jgi:hypothetical protein
VINVDPGFIATERMAQDMAGFGFGSDGEPPEVVGAVVRWLATDPGAKELSGTTIFAQKFCSENKLLPGWDGPTPRRQKLRPDLVGSELLKAGQEAAAQLDNA